MQIEVKGQKFDLTVVNKKGGWIALVNLTSLDLEASPIAFAKTKAEAINEAIKFLSIYLDHG